MSFKSRKILIVFLAQADKPPNIRLDEDVLKRSLRHLDQDDYIGLSNTSSRRLQTFSKRFQDVFKTSCKNVFKTSSKLDILKTSCQDILKASSKRLQDVLRRCLQDIFLTFSRRIIKLSYSCRCISKNFRGHWSKL